MARVLVCGDPHAPCMHPRYVGFLEEIWKQWRCDTFVCIGDLADWTAISFHDRHPGFPNAVDECEAAREQIGTLYDAFGGPGVVLLGNHDVRPARLAATVGIPEFLLVDHAKLWDTPMWEYVPRYGFYEQDGVIYQHGEKGFGGLRSCIRNATSNFTSMAQGHLHSQCGVEWFVNEHHRVFAMQTGCGIDINRLQFDYARKMNHRPILGCGVVLDGEHGFVEVMDLK